MRRATTVIGAVVIALAGIVIAAPFAFPGTNMCQSCHSPGSASGEYLFRPPVVSVTSPAVSPPDTLFDCCVTVTHYGKWTMKNTVLSINITDNAGLVSGQTYQRSFQNIGSAGGTAAAIWKILARQEGKVTVNITTEYTAHFQHTTASDSNDYNYRIMTSSRVLIRPVALSVSVNELFFRAGKVQSASFDITGLSQAKNISITPCANLGGALTVNPNSISTMDIGTRTSIAVTYSGTGGIVNNGRLDIIWENATGFSDSAFISVRVQDIIPVTENISPFSLMGRATGMVCLALLISSIVLGLVKMGKSRRVRIHCAISWFILGLSIYHGTILVLGPYSNLLTNSYVILGYLSAVVMGVSSVNGILAKWMSKKLGAQTWLNLHRICTVAGIVLVIVHGMLMGTDFRFLRELSGGAGSGEQNGPGGK